MESIWARAFNSFGFIAVLVCIAVFLTTLSSSFARQHRAQPADLLQLSQQTGIVAEIHGPVSLPGRTAAPIR